jgi:hypothetical protein
VKVVGFVELEELFGRVDEEVVEVVGERDDFVVIGEVFVGACADVVEVDVGSSDDDERDVWGTETGVFVEVACCSDLEEGQSQLRS